MKYENYERWVRKYDTLSNADRDAIGAHIRALPYKPVISIVMPAYEPPVWAFLEAIRSVREQLYPNWELCVVDDASPSPHVAEILSQAQAEDARIKWMRHDRNGNISAASNSALSLATGDFVALLDHDDVLPAHALYEIVTALNNNPTLDILYSDEDQIDREGRRHTPYFKTDWNIDLQLGHNMISHLGVYRRSLIESVGHFREGFEGSQDYDLALRCVEATSADRIHHIPTVLYHWRRDHGGATFSEGKLNTCSDGALRAISEHLQRLGETGYVSPHPYLPQWTRVVRSLPSSLPLVSLIIPTRDRADLLAKCVDGLLRQTNYPTTELLIVDHESQLPETRMLLAKLGSESRVRILPFSGAFNFSAMNNMAASQARGSILGLLNNDIEIIDPQWLSEMVALAVMPDVGAVGAKLLYPDDRVQHGGVVLGLGGIANHLNHRLDRRSRGYFGRNQLTSAVSAVSGACLIVRKSVYDEVGGLDESNLPVAFNDVDFCLKVAEKGYRNIWTPHAELYHHESASRGADTTPARSARLREESDYMLKRWGKRLTNDPFYNENISLDIGKCFQLAFPPRRRKPWMKHYGGLQGTASDIKAN